jgi:hypothetical protein
VGEPVVIPNREIVVTSDTIGTPTKGVPVVIPTPVRG